MIGLVNIPTARLLETARKLSVSDATGAHTGAAAAFDGSGDVTLLLPATLAADITGNAATATNATKLGGYALQSTNTAVWSTVPRIGADGVTELGKYIDFHTTSAGGTDYDVRVTAGNSSISVSGSVTATSFIGNVTGNCSGSSGSCTGNAATATKLKTAVTINGTSFDGSKAIVLDTVASVTEADGKVTVTKSDGTTSTFDVGKAASLFDIDTDGGIMPAAETALDENFEVDANNDIQPKEA